MKSKLLVWIPRVITLIFIIFISMFAFDEKFISFGFLMHMLPTLLLIGLLIIAWNWATLGGLILLVFGIISIFFFRTYEDPIVFLIVSFPIFVVGILFILSDQVKGKKRKIKKKGK